MFGVWNKEQEKFLKENYKFMTYKEIGKNIGKSENSVSKKAQFLNLKKIERIKNQLPRETQVKREINGRMKMEKYGIDKEIGDKARIKLRCNLKVPIRIFEGEVIFKNKNIITVQGKNYKESFMLAEFHTGQAIII